MLYQDPCVFAVADRYQIAFNTLEAGVAWVEIDGQCYRDSENGLMRSETLIHKVDVPMTALDAARAYTVCFRALPERKPYFPQLGPLQQKTYAFKPADFSRDVHAYMLADTHSRVEGPVRAAAYWGDALDLLILNGDIPAESKTPEDIRAIYDITSALTHGSLPVIFARGNHDYRGRLATALPQYIGTQAGRTYFTLRLGSLWCVVIDCGEDKDDSHVEYGGLVDCHAMRLEETEFLKSIVANAESEYLAPGVTTRLAITHVPFPTELLGESSEIFDIERALFLEWTQLLNEMRLDAMLCGHMHYLKTLAPHAPGLRTDTNFPIYIGSLPIRGENGHPAYPGATFVGTALTLKASGGLDVRFTADAPRG